MTVFNKRNALVGFITLKAASRALERRKRRRRHGAKIAAFVALGLVSAGVLAAFAAILYRRHGGEVEQRLEGYGIGDDESEIVGEYVSAGPESIPAT
jgi:hypothetical protein